MSHHLKAAHISDEMHHCIENCSDCHDVCTETLIHCLGMGAGDERFRSAERTWPHLAIGQARGIVERRAEQRTLLLGIGPEAGRPQTLDRLAVGLDQRHIDAVHGRAAHQADGNKRGHRAFL